MAKLSQRRQVLLEADIPCVRQLYAEACVRFGADKVHGSPMLVWSMRCMAGVQGRMPFMGGLVSQNAGEFLHVLRTHVLKEQGDE